MKEKIELDEPILEDDYPVYSSYLYVADGHVIRSHLHGTVKKLKHDLKVAEVRRCDIAARRLWHLVL